MDGTNRHFAKYVYTYSTVICQHSSLGRFAGNSRKQSRLSRINVTHL